MNINFRKIFMVKLTGFSSKLVPSPLESSRWGLKEFHNRSGIQKCLQNN